VRVLRQPEVGVKPQLLQGTQEDAPQLHHRTE
jgi:hypothetical protein